MNIQDKLEYVFQHSGIDLKQECQISEHRIEIDGIKLNRSGEPTDEREIDYSLFDIVLSSVLRRKSECSRTMHRYCTT